MRAVEHAFDPTFYPVAWAFETLEATKTESDGTTTPSTLVLLRLSTPTGVNEFPFDPESGSMFIEQFKQMLHRAKTGIVLATPADIPPTPLHRV